MKIAVVSRACSIRSGARAAVEIAKNLCEKNKIVYCSSSEGFDLAAREYLEESGAEVKVFQSFSLPIIGPLPNLFSLVFFLKKEKVDVICLHAPLMFSLACKLSGIPTLATYYGFQLNAYLERFLPDQKFFFFHSVLNWIFNKVSKLIFCFRFALADEVIGNTQYTAFEFERLFKKKIDFIYQGGDFGEFKTEFKRKPRGKDEINLLSVSRLTPYKNFHFLIKIFKKLSKRVDDVHLIIIGSISRLNYYHRLLSILPSNAEILTDVSDEELISYYQNCDVYATCDEYLFFGLPVLEAAFLNKPSIALDRCAAREVVEDGVTGFVAENEEEFCDKLERLAKDEVLRLNMGEKAGERAGKMFTWGKCAREYEEKLNELLDQK